MNTTKLMLFQIDEGKVNYIRKGDVKHTCSLKELAVTDKVLILSIYTCIKFEEIGYMDA